MNTESLLPDTDTVKNEKTKAENLDDMKKNSKDSICLLTKYTWEQPYKVDTAKVDKNGSMTFRGKDPLEKGIYSLYSPKKGVLYFDLIINESQKLTINTDTNNFYDNKTQVS